MSVPIRLVEATRGRSRSRMEPRELRANLLVGLPFVVVAVLLVALELDQSVAVGDTVLFVLAAAVIGRLKFETGTGATVPTQLIFVPMLFVLPPVIVPFVVAAALALSQMPEVLAGRRHPQRLLLIVCDSWYSVGPVIVFLLFDVQSPHWGDWPIYVLALVAQFGGDLLSSTVSEWLAYGVLPRLQLTVLREIWLVDALLSPVGLLAAFASTQRHFAYLLALPLAILLAVFARDRHGSIDTQIELSETYRGTALMLGDVISADDELASAHSHGVVALALAISEELAMDEDERRLVEFASMLHDIGKIETPREILQKPGPLTDEEWEAMRLHTIAGQRMLDRVGGTLHDVGLVVRSARERFGGGGYPDGLAGEQIPLAARVVAVAAAYCAMTASRPYRPALSPAAAVDELCEHTGTQFDPNVVAAACVVLDRGLPEPSPLPADVS
jgi:HD-GYP domain-containing protein (c-di-GMP phosphodiesterase class II)